LLDLHSMHERGAIDAHSIQPRNVALAKTMATPAHIVVWDAAKDRCAMRLAALASWSARW
jgi:hypothetical protein